jgi:transposase
LDPESVTRVALRAAAVAAAVVLSALGAEHLYFEWSQSARARIASAVTLSPGQLAAEAVGPMAASLVAQVPEPPTSAPEPVFLKPTEKDSLLGFYAPYSWVEHRAPVEIWLVATNGLAQVRRESLNRLSPRIRGDAIRAAGGSPFLAARIDSMAADIAGKIDESLRAGSATVQDVALSVRALLASGSTLRVGAHQETPDALTTAERDELTRLRRENKRLSQERDILKAAATFFAKESE